jgi:hypothetical protein
MGGNVVMKSRIQFPEGERSNGARCLSGRAMTVSLNLSKCPGFPVPICLQQSAITDKIKKQRFMRCQVPELIEMVKVIRLFSAALILLLLVGCDADPAIIVVHDIIVNEGEGVAKVKIELSHESRKKVSVHYSVLNINATPGHDYIPSQGVVEFSPGVLSQVINVRIIDDKFYDDNEKFYVSLSQPVNAHFSKHDGLPQNIIMVTIADDDTQPVVSFVRNIYSLSEKDKRVKIEVRLSHSVDHEVVLPLDIVGNASLMSDYDGNDYVVFKPGENKAFLLLNILDDSEPECPEMLNIVVGENSGFRQGGGDVTIHIADDDVTGAHLLVGPGAKYSKPSEASSAVKAGDLIEIKQGDYHGDTAVWKQDDLLLCGQGDGVVLHADGHSAEGKAIWVVKGNRVTVENISFLNAKVPDGNGAGIRVEGKDIVIRRSRFLGNQNGVLAGRNQASSITIEHSVFRHNGDGSGKTHGVYIGQIGTLVLRFNVFQETLVGHNVKSRARVNLLYYNWIGDLDSGRASYQVDFPNGGKSLLVGNVIQQGKAAENSAMIAYGMEGSRYDVNELLLSSNTLVNNLGRGIFVNIKGGPVTRYFNNYFCGRGAVPVKNGVGGNLVTQDCSDFVNQKKFDYRLTGESKAIDAGRVDLVNDPNLVPHYEILSDGNVVWRIKAGAIDVGAYEYAR